MEEYHLKNPDKIREHREAYRRKRFGDRTREQHRMHKHPAYSCWAAMKTRCDNPKDAFYKNYGGRGIAYRPEWKKFSGFWGDMKEDWRKGLSLDRIDNDGNYEPGNCRWATPSQQQRNTRSNRWITYKEKTMILMDWSKELNMKYNLLRYRLDAGWSVERAFTEPVGLHSGRHTKNQLNG